LCEYQGSLLVVPGDNFLVRVGITSPYFRHYLSIFTIMSIRTVGVVGTGVIGASWTGLFLAHGLKVIVFDPAPGAERGLADYLHSIWPTLEKQKRSPHAALTNYRFVGDNFKDHFAHVDFVQEVHFSHLLHFNSYTTLMGVNRMHQNDSS
jgi:hypothetical protein